MANEFTKVMNKIERMKGLAEQIEIALKECEEGSFDGLTIGEWIAFIDETQQEFGLFISYEEQKALAQFMLAKNQNDEI